MKVQSITVHPKMCIWPYTLRLICISRVSGAPWILVLEHPSEVAEPSNLRTYYQERKKCKYYLKCKVYDWEKAVTFALGETIFKGISLFGPILWNDSWGFAYRQLKFSFQQIFNISTYFSSVFGKCALLQVSSFFLI